MVDLYAFQNTSLMVNLQKKCLNWQSQFQIYLLVLMVLDLIIYVDKMVDNNICTDDYFNNIFDNRINSSNLPVNQKRKHLSYKSQAELLKK